MSEQKGTIIVTGANGGLGSSIVSKVVSTPELSKYYGVYTARDRLAAPSITSALRMPTGLHSHPHSHTLVSLDLARMDSVRRVAADINSRVLAGELPPIRALILNAGVHEFQSQTWTQDGFDLSFAVNYLGHWLLTLLLLQSMDRESGRIVVVGSLSHDPNAPQNNSAGQFSDPKWKVILQDGTEPVAKGTWSTAKDDPSWCSGFRRYGASKLCELLMIGELQRRLNRDPLLKNISIVGLDPGTMPTAIGRRSPWFIRILIFRVILPFLARLAVLLSPNGALRTPEKSATDVLSAALDVGLDKGIYLDGRKKVRMSAEAQDIDTQAMLWGDTIRYTQLKQGESILPCWD